MSRPLVPGDRTLDVQDNYLHPSSAQGFRALLPARGAGGLGGADWARLIPNSSEGAGRAPRGGRSRSGRPPLPDQSHLPAASPRSSRGALTS